MFRFLMYAYCLSKNNFITILKTYFNSGKFKTYYIQTFDILKVVDFKNFKKSTSLITDRS